MQAVALVVAVILMIALFRSPDSYIRMQKGIELLMEVSAKASKADLFLSTWILLIWPIGIFIQWGIPIIMFASQTDAEQEKWLRRYCFISFFRWEM